MATETQTRTMPDADRHDDGIGRNHTTTRSSIDELGNVTRSTRGEENGPDSRSCPDFGSGGHSGNSSLF